MEKKSLNKFGKAQCACCDFFTISEIGETCPVCYWEENVYQEEHQDDNDAPNYVSLLEARKNFDRIGAKSPSVTAQTRKPLPNEVADP